MVSLDAGMKLDPRRAIQTAGSHEIQKLFAVPFVFFFESDHFSS
jgi:hypothetical protein